MEEMEVHDKPGLMTRLKSMFTYADGEEDTDAEPDTKKARPYELRPAYKYHVTVWQQMNSLDDMYAAAQGFKRGEQQVLNLTGTEPTLRERIINFMSGVNFAQEGTWEEIGENIYIVVPVNVFVELAEETPRTSVVRP